MTQMKEIRRAAIAAVLAAALISGVANAEALRIGVLPAADSIVLYAAADEGLFKRQGSTLKSCPSNPRWSSVLQCVPDGLTVISAIS